MWQIVLENKKNKKAYDNSLKKTHISNYDVKVNRKRLLYLTIPFVIVSCAYIGGTAYYSSHFYHNTVINNVNVSSLNIDAALYKMQDFSMNYGINIYGRDNVDDFIDGDDIDFKLSNNSKEALFSIKNKQKSFLWFLGYFKNYNYADEDIFSVDDEKFTKVINNSNIVKKSGTVNSKEPSYKFNGKDFEIIDAVQGNKLHKDKAVNHIKEAVLCGYKKFNIENTDGYIKTKYTKDSKCIVDNLEKLNKYKTLKLTYVLDDVQEVIDCSIFSDWFSFDDNGQFSLNKEKIQKYVETLSEKYNTAGKPKKFTTTDGRNIVVSGGDYGRIIDKKAETNKILQMFNNNKSEKREPIYTEKAMANGKNDIGNTYVEVNLSSQHLWFYKNGSLITEGDVVSGNMANGTATPAGVYRLKFKQTNAVLVGDTYRTPVSYWMPFNGGIGIHDATWRGAFGGQIYTYGGSHGCVNAPFTLAQTIFRNIDAGTPIVCYY